MFVTSLLRGREHIIVTICNQGARSAKVKSVTTSLMDSLKSHEKWWRDCCWEIVGLTIRLSQIEKKTKYLITN